MSINKNYVMAGMLATAVAIPLSDTTTSHASETRITIVRVHFRTGAGTNYSSMGILDKGVKVSYISESGNWTKVEYDSKTGYICSDYLEKGESNATPTSTMYTTPEIGLNLRKGPGTSYSVVKTLSKGTAVTVHSSSNGWSKISVNGVEGYVSTSFLSSTNPSTSGSSSSSSSNSSTSVSVDKVLDFAHQQLGKPYVWGAQGPNSFDCSGLIYYVYKNAANITLPRTSVEQSKFGTTVSKSNLKAGDLIFFDTNGPNNGAVSHVGIYAGEGQLIHASSSNKKIVKVNMETSYWNNTYVIAKRVL